MFYNDIELETWIADGGIKGGDPRVQPCSVDLTLGDGLRYCGPSIGYVPSHPEADRNNMYDAGQHAWRASNGSSSRTDLNTGVKETWFILQPGQFALGTTAETVRMMPWQAGQVHGKSTLGRNGLMVHVTAGLIDPGFTGQVTLELLNVSPNPLVLKVGQPICQIQVCGIRQARSPYNGHYQGQEGTTVPWTN